jgi:hypothetical protein
VKLTKILVQNYRSFTDKTELALSGGMNALVGPNNCGKSNLLSAVGMALDPDYRFDRKHDVPGQRKFAFPRSTLTFQCETISQPEKTLLRYVEAYERSVGGFTGSTYAQDGLLRLVVSYRVTQTGAARQEYFAARSVGDRRGDNLVAQAVLLRAEAKQPVWVLVDSDENGRKARDALIKRFGVATEDVLQCGKFLNGLPDAESEWLFPAELMQRFVDAQGEEKVLKSKQKIGGQFRYDFTPAGKELFPRWLNEYATPEDMGGWQPIVDALLKKLRG